MNMKASQAAFYDCRRPATCEEEPESTPIVTVPLGRGLLTQYFGPTKTVSFFRLLNQAGDVLCQGDGAEYPGRPILVVESDEVYTLPPVDVEAICFSQVLAEELDKFLSGRRP